MITVGVTELHGIAKEAMAHPPDGIHYISTVPRPILGGMLITSPAKGVWHRADGVGCDLIEAPLFPVLTDKPWIYTPANLAAMAAFGVAGLPLPRSLRMKFCVSQMKRENFKALVFKSEKGRSTANSYGHITDETVLEKTHVVYPAMRKIDDDLVRYHDGPVRFLCSGDFFSKGSASVVDAFEELQKERDDIHLRICASPEMPIADERIREEYRHRVASNPAIEIGQVSREELLESILPASDVFVSPTFHESFGFAILEACAFGLPVIATARFAIPEIVEHGAGGFLIPIEHFDFIRHGSAGTVSSIPAPFHQYLTREVLTHMRTLVGSPAIRRQMGAAAIGHARRRFSFKKRNAKMLEIYASATGR